MTRRYQVEAWRGLDCVRVESVTRPATVLRRASVMIADGADRLYIRWTGDAAGVAAAWTLTGGWRRVDDAALADHLAAEDYG